MRCGAKSWFEMNLRLVSRCGLLAYCMATGTAHAQSDAAAHAAPGVPPAAEAALPADQPAAPAEPPPIPDSFAPAELPVEPPAAAAFDEAAAPPPVAAEAPPPVAPAPAVAPAPPPSAPAPAPVAPMRPSEPQPAVSFPSSTAAPSARAELDRAPITEEREDRDDGPLGYGLMVDVAVPDGLMGSVVFRPFWWLRTHAGGGTNSISGGMRLGVSLIPFGAGPSLTGEVGHYFEGDANSFAQDTIGIRDDTGGVLERVGYDFANAHLGLEFGQERVAFFIHGGISYLRTVVHNANSLLANSNSDAETTTTITINQDPTLVAIVPSAKLGLVAYIL
jgi:hypothetical protein